MTTILPEITARQLVSLGFNSDLARQLERTTLDSNARIVWVGGHTARLTWFRFVQCFNTVLQKRMLPILLRCGLREHLNQLDCYNDTVFEETLQVSTNAAIILLEEHKRDAANCPIDFNVQREGQMSTFMRAVVNFTSYATQEWITYIASLSTQTSLNSRQVLTGESALSIVLGGPQDSLLTRLHTLTSQLISPDDETGLLWLAGAANVWKWKYHHLGHRSPDGLITPQECIRQRNESNHGIANVSVFPFLSAQDTENAAVRLMDNVIARHASYRVLTLSALKMHFRGILPLCVLVASYITPRLATNFQKEQRIEKMSDMTRGQWSGLCNDKAAKERMVAQSPKNETGAPRKRSPKASTITDTNRRAV